MAIEVFTVGAGTAVVMSTLPLPHPEGTTHALLSCVVLGIAMKPEDSSRRFAVSEFSET